MKSPRMIKSHLHHFLLPEQLQNGKGRIIYLVRNPKDVVTSFYNFMADQLVEGDRVFENFFDGFVNGTEFACPWPRHVLEYWSRRDDPNVPFFRFEDVVKDKPAAIRRIADLLGRTLTEEDVTKIADHCLVDNMRVNDKVNFSYWKDIRYVNENAKGAHINKGEPGAWHAVLTQEQSARIDEMMHELDGSGLEIVHT
ncbi:amine sulfotransferase-like [Mercenaria mercenaria]|uniref:amine sulfotransferase-like n=1 Tax=Mercenaria mercenaria TaxID=6596 RepID=UPI00234E493D|nr:amine sulfotransferase-like [Mercenaria mercenaria]